MHNGQDQDANVYYNMRKDSPDEEVTALDRTCFVLNVRVPKRMHRITVKGSKKDLGLLASGVLFCGAAPTHTSDNPDDRADQPDCNDDLNVRNTEHTPVEG